MWVETKQRIIDILKTLTAPTGTHFEVADFMPKSRSDHHWYLITVRANRDAIQPATAPESRTHMLNFIIECTSQQINTSSEVIHEYRIEAYADAITALLERYPRLETVHTNSIPGRVPLTGVISTFLPGSQFQSPFAYPQGGPINHYSVNINLQVMFKRSTGC